MSTNKLPTKFFFPIIFLAVSFGYFWSIHGFTLTGIDDANIFFVYAKNFSSGAGFVYNIGGEHVEGFSSILWTLIGSLVFYIADFVAVKPELILLMLNLLLVVVTAAVSQSFIVQFPDAERDMRLWQAGFLFLLLTAPNFIFWSTFSLMEVALWCLLLTLTTVLILRTELNGATSGLLSALFVLMILTRPESYLWVFLFSAIYFLRLFQKDGWKRAVTLLLAPIVTIIMTIGLVTIFRLNYFGYPFPNTYYAKVSPSIGWNLFEGSRYLIGFALSNPIATLAVIAVFANLYKLVATLIRFEGTITPMLFLSAIGFVGLSIPLITGGDHFAGYRFYQAIYPILLVNLTY